MSSQIGWQTAHAKRSGRTKIPFRADTGDTQVSLQISSASRLRSYLWCAALAVLMVAGAARAADVSVAPQKPLEPPPGFDPEFKALPPPVVNRQPLYVQQQFKYPEDGFSIEAGETPIISKQTENGPKGPAPVRSYAFPGKNSVFIVRVRRHDPADARTADQRLTQMTTTEAKPIEHEVVTGRDFDRKNGGMTTRVRVFAVGSIDYELIYQEVSRQSHSEVVEFADAWLKRWHLIPMPSAQSR